MYGAIKNEKKVVPPRMIVSIYLSEPFPSFPPKYLLSLSPTESLLCSSDGKLWFPHTNSIGSDLTSSFKRFGGDGVKLSLSVDDDDNPLPFALLVKLFGAKIRRKNEKKNRLKFPYIKHFVKKKKTVCFQCSILERKSYSQSDE